MATIRIELPDLLLQVIEVPSTAYGRDFEIEAETLEGALQTIRQEHPRLATHLFDEQNKFREHVLCFLNEQNSRWLDDFSVKLNDGDRLLFMQAVSGG